MTSKISSGNPLAPLILFFGVLLGLIWVVAECVRIQCAKTGNKNERLPLLSFSLLLSIFPQVPLLLFFLCMFPLASGFRLDLALSTLAMLAIDVAAIGPVYMSIRTLSAATAEVVNLLHLR